MPKQASKRDRPSYEEGRVRDPRVEEKQDPKYRRDDLKRVIRKAAPVRKSS